MDEIVQFDFPTDSPKIIKVIGVGGGGGNAVNHMFKEGIHDVTFVLCNTDNQALAESPVPVKLQLGRSITEGLGAGNRPDRAKDAAEESIENLKQGSTLVNYSVTKKFQKKKNTGFFIVMLFSNLDEITY